MGMGDCCDNCLHGEVCCSVVEVRENPPARLRGRGRNRRMIRVNPSSLASIDPSASGGIESPIITPAAIMDLHQAQVAASARVARTNPSGVPWAEMSPESKRKWMIGGGIALAVAAGAGLYWYRSRQR